MSPRRFFSKTRDYLTDFEPGKSGAEKFSIIAALLLIQLLYVWFIIVLLTMFFSQMSLQKYVFWGWYSKDNVMARLSVSLKQNLLISFFFAVVLAPLWEEFAFRAYWFWKKLRKRDKEDLLVPLAVQAKIGRMPIWDFVIFSSIVFGIAHGGPMNILIQGVGGVFLSYVFLRNGRSYWSAVLLHALYNATVILFAYFFSSNAIAALTMPYWLTWIG